MDIIKIIEKKMNKKNLREDEINFFVKEFVLNNIPDYQASALLMAIWFNSMDRQEIIALTNAMVKTGYRTKPENIKATLIDKHSTGGVADSTTIISCCIVAACGGKVLKASGRGLGFTGGTIDKLEAIPGFKTEIPDSLAFELLEKNNFVLTSQSDSFVPADKILYSLRDATSTVDSLPLIASSVMSKKLATAVDVIVLDVKCGNGAFMTSLSEAKELAQIMVDIGRANNKKTLALITDMNQPLGQNIGNSLEIEEIIDILSNKIKSSRLKTLSIELAAQMLYQAEIFSGIEIAREKANQAVSEGKALEAFKNFIKNQGGNPEIIYDYNLLPQAKFIKDIIAKESGFVAEINTRELGNLARDLGAGRLNKDDVIDLAAGVKLNFELGDFIEKGKIIATLYSNKNMDLSEIVQLFLEKITVTKEKAIIPVLIKAQID